MFSTALKSVLHNLGVLAVGFGVAFLCSNVDAIPGVRNLRSAPAAIGGAALSALGFGLRTWAACHFYSHSLRVISLEPQKALLTSGPYRFSRNPLHLGGNVFIFFGAAPVLGSPTMAVATALHLPLLDRLIRREERRLERDFGDEFRACRGRVRRRI